MKKSFSKYYFKENVLDNWDEIKQKYPNIQNAIELMDKINKAGFEALMVGGVVRDLVLGNEPNDVDITTDAIPDQIEKIFGKVIDIGQNKKMGVSVVPYKGENYEIATYRKDQFNDLSKGKGADTVELTTSFKDDTSRRDFKINQLGIDKDGNIIDNWGGLKDIKNKVISTVGDPNLRFKEDQIRSLRAVRFSSRLGFTISPETIEAMKQNAPEITKVAPERITKELMKMAEQSGPAFAEAIITMDKVGLLQYILPEIFKMHELEHNKEFHPETDDEGKHTVFGHVIQALRSQPLKDSILNLSVLMHDVGKINTQSIDDQGFIHYLRHAQEADKLIDQIADRLKFDNETRRKIQFAAINHMKAHEILAMSNSKIAELMNNDAFDILIKVAEADARARGKLFDDVEWQKILSKINDIAIKFKDKKAKDAVKKVVNGNWVMGLKGITKPGPEVGRIINTTVDWIIDSGIDMNDTKAIEDYIKSI
jgi:tRNA nucleotidyltransferase/poly(A) polymerase